MRPTCNCFLGPCDRYLCVMPNSFGMPLTEHFSVISQQLLFGVKQSLKATTKREDGKSIFPRNSVPTSTSPRRPQQRRGKRIAISQIIQLFSTHVHNRRHNNVKSVFFSPQQAAFAAAGVEGEETTSFSPLSDSANKSILSIPLSPAALFAWVAATADLLGMLFRSMKIMKEIMDFPFSKLLAYTMCRESGLGGRDRPPTIRESEWIDNFIKSHSHGESIEAVNGMSKLCLCLPALTLHARPSTDPPPHSRLTCVFTQKGFSTYIVEHHHWLRWVGGLQKCWSFYTHSTTSPPPPARLSGRGRESEPFISVLFMFSSIFLSFSTLTMKNQQNRSFWFASVFQQSSFRLDVLFGRRSRWRWRIRILSPFLLGPDLIFGRFYREIKSEKQKRENVRKAKFYTSQHCKDVVEW